MSDLAVARSRCPRCNRVRMLFVRWYAPDEYPLCHSCVRAERMRRADESSQFSDQVRRELPGNDRGDPSRWVGHWKARVKYVHPVPRTRHVAGPNCHCGCTL